MNPITRCFWRQARRFGATGLALICLASLEMGSAALDAGNVAATLPANMSAVPAGQVRTSAEEDIRDIRPPYPIPAEWLWLAWAAGGVVLIALGYGAWRLHRRRSERVKLPYELALERLEAARQLMRPEKARVFSIAVSEVVRDYIEVRFSARAAHHTTDEFLRGLATRADSPLAVHQPVLSDFLHHCDLAKFARWNLSIPQMEAMLQSAAAFIVATGKPIPGVPANAAGDVSRASKLEAKASIPKNLNAGLS
jgi:hypothetical protein